MKVTVKDCLELEGFANARVLAGGKNLEGEVRQISVLDACLPEDYDLIDTAETEILLTGFMGIRDDAEKQCSLIREIAEKGCAALAVFYGEDSIALDSIVIDTAEMVGVPLISMPADARYSRTISEVMDRVLYGENFSNSLINNTVFHLLNFEKHSSFQDAVREAAINNDFQIFLLSEDFNPVFGVETMHRVPLSDALRIGREKTFDNEKGKVYTLIDVEGALTYWGLVNIGNEKYYMLIVDNEDSYTAGEITKLAEIVELAMGMWKYTPERDARSEFIKALIRGNKSLAYTLQDEIRIEGTDIVSVFFTKGIERERETQIFADFEKKTDLEKIGRAHV